MQIQASAGGASVDVQGSTNLPDGAVISVNVSRAFHNQGETDIRAIDAGSLDATVSGGHFFVSVPIDESTLLLFVGKGASDDQIDQVDRHLTVCADFETGSEIGGKARQSDSVSAIVGPNGETLAGSPQVYVFGSATKTPANWLEVMSDLPVHSPQFDALTEKQGFAADEVALDGFCVT